MRYGKLSFMLSLVCALVSCMDCFGQGTVIYRSGETAFLNNTCGGTASASCSGASSLRTPVRNLVSARPIRTAASGILQRIQSVGTRSGCGNSRATGCGQAASLGCAGSQAPQATGCNCGCEQGQPCTCSSQKSVPVLSCPTGTCNLVESQQQFATPIRSFVSNSYQQALASAQHRANNRIHGHSYLDTHRTSGVGWATSDSTPNTCLGRGGESYAVVRGSDGWYATKFTQ